MKDISRKRPDQELYVGVPWDSGRNGAGQKMGCGISVRRSVQKKATVLYSDGNTQVPP